MTQEKGTPIHLREVLGAENKHELALQGTVTLHEAQRLDIFRLVLNNLFLEQHHLMAQLGYGVVEVGQVHTHGLNAAFLVLNLGVEHHEVLEPGLDVLLIVTESLLLLLDLTLKLLTLVLQSLNGRVGGSGFLLAFLLLGRFLVSRFLFLLYRRSSRLLARLLTLLGVRRQTEGGKQNRYNQKPLHEDER